MSQRDPLPTRTSEAILAQPAESDPVDVRRSGTRARAIVAEGLSAIERTELLPLAGSDAAAVSFSLERERALRRAEHSASVARLRRSLSIGIWIWLSTVPFDLFITEYVREGNVVTFLAARAFVTLLVLGVLWRLRRLPEPSPRLLWWLDVACFTSASLGVSLMSLSYRGSASPYASGIIAILVSRGATTLAPWRRGAWLFGIPALAYPATVLIASCFDPSVAAQLADTTGAAPFVSSLYILLECWAMLTLGGHFAWQLRREALETRNIGRYKLERRLGSGGMAEVWAAFDLTLKQRVALKTVSGHRPGSAQLERLEREVRALAELTHPNTVRVYDYGVTEDGLWYYAMELLHGETLRERVLREGPLPTERVLRTARQVLRALGEAHKKGIIHRDIKPDNVFIAEVGGEAEVAKLLDFGIAKTTLSGDATLTHTGFVAGTPAYMAPELIQGRPADIRSDIYSFGATLYFALSGRLPFGEQNATALFAAHLMREPEPLSHFTLEPIPAELERVVQRCMAKLPDERYPSTQALLEALAF